jgi:polysaccharide deacetylase 2 family uncharacterized protein YibQ
LKNFAFFVIVHASRSFVLMLLLFGDQREMGFGSENGKRPKRSPKGRLGRLMAIRVDAAEAVLAAMAVVLVVWLLWPEEHGPRFADRVDEQQPFDQAERDQTQSVAAPAQTAEAALESIRERSASITRDAPSTAAATDRQRIATPSEWADRLQAKAVGTVQPAPKRPQSAPDSTTIGGDTSRTAGADDNDGERGLPSPELIPPETVQAALADMIDRLKDGQPKDDPELRAAAGVADDLSHPVQSTERLETDSLADIDLSDLDTLVPVPEDPAPVVDEAQMAAVDPAITIPVEPAPSSAPDDDALIAPFVVERDPSVPDNDVSARPRDDAPTWLRNAVASAYADERPIIAIVLDDLGLNRRNTAAVNDLPAPLTLAFLPYAGRIEAQTQAAHDAGHELMLHMPMEPLGSEWPGPDALTTKIDQGEFIKRLLKNLDRFDGFVGINNHMGSKLTADSSRMEAVMQELRKRDVLFLDSKTSARSVAGHVAGELGVPNTTRDIFLDNVINIESIKRQLELTERVARQTGSAVAIGHPHGSTIEALRQWLPTLEDRGFALAPISAVVARRACSRGVLIADETCGRYLQVQKTVQPALVSTDS